MNMKLNHNYEFLYMYTKNLIKVFKNPSFDNNFPFKNNLKLCLIFYQMIKK